MLTLAAHRLEGETALEPIFQIYRKRWEIEALFGWIQEKTGIRTASKVRSERGLMVHVFGRLAAAMFLLAFNL